MVHNFALEAWFVIHERSWLKAPLWFGFRQAQLKIHPSGMGRHLWNCPGLWGEV